MTEFKHWCIVELMGHRRLAGLASEEEIGGQGFLRLDVPAPDGDGFSATQYYGSSAIYCITLTDEETARAVAKAAQPTPVQRWELPRPTRSDHNVEQFYEDDDEDDEDEQRGKE